MARIYEYKDSIIEKIHKNRRRINAYFRQNQIKRIKVIIVLVVAFCSCFNNIFALENPNINYGEYKIQSDKDEFMYITYKGKMVPNYEYYYTVDGQNIPAYCVDYGLDGAEAYESGYVINANEKIQDDKLMNIIFSGYPYKDKSEYNIWSDREFKFATQFAIWCYTSDVDINLVEPISDMNIDLVNAIKKIYNSKDNKKEDDWDYIVDEQGFIESDNIKYYYKDICFNWSNVTQGKVKAYTEDKNVLIESNKYGYRVFVPVDYVDDEYNVKVKLDLNVNENIALFGRTTIGGTQNYIVTLGKTFDTSTDIDVNFKSDITKVKVYKKDKDSNIPIPGVKYMVTNEKNEELGVYTTKNDGSFTIKLYNNDCEKLFFREIEPANGYVLDTEIHEVKISNNNTSSVSFTNEKEKGYIEIWKKTKEYNKFTHLPENSPLKGVRFKVYDINGKVVDNLITDENGYCKSIRLPLGKYFIKEIETLKYYELLSKNLEVEIKENNDNIAVQILNDNIFIEEKLPVTGK